MPELIAPSLGSHLLGRKTALPKKRRSNPSSASQPVPRFTFEHVLAHMPSTFSHSRSTCGTKYRELPGEQNLQCRRVMHPMTQRNKTQGQIVQVILEYRYCKKPLNPSDSES